MSNTLKELLVNLRANADRLEMQADVGDMGRKPDPTETKRVAAAAMKAAADALEAAAVSNARKSPRTDMGDGRPFQPGVADWMAQCFGPTISADKLERADRFTEEALELAQTMPGFNADRAHALVDYVFARAVGDAFQEVGGVMVTLAALCNTIDIDIGEAAETELARVWTKVEQIRAKQAAKPTGSALPIALRTGEATDVPRAEIQAWRDAIGEVVGAMLEGGDGEIGDFGWNISKLTKARPAIRDALAKLEAHLKGA